MDLVIVTGMSGAGKSVSIKALEDLGYFCIDNIIPQLIPEAVEAMQSSQSHDGSLKMAISADTRVGEFFYQIYSALDKLKLSGIPYRILFLDASDDTLINRYNETKRTHPLAKGRPINKAIEEEREILLDLKTSANVIINTTNCDPKTLKQKIYNIYGTGEKKGGIAIVTFGFKRGMPKGCDMVLDVRHLPNPYYDKLLRPLNGQNASVRDYVFKDGNAEKFSHAAAKLIDLVAKDYLPEVKNLLTVGIGCTGGKHRSVAVAERIAEILREQGHEVAVYHRHMYMD